MDLAQQNENNKQYTENSVKKLEQSHLAHFKSFCKGLKAQK